MREVSLIKVVDLKITMFGTIPSFPDVTLLKTDITVSGVNLSFGSGSPAGHERTRTWGWNNPNHSLCCTNLD